MINKAYLLKLAEADLSNAEENLYRAKHAQRRASDPSKPYGQSDQSLNEIVAGYQRWRDEAKQAVESLQEE